MIIELRMTHSYVFWHSRYVKNFNMYILVIECNLEKDKFVQETDLNTFGSCVGGGRIPPTFIIYGFFFDLHLLNSQPN